MPLSKGAIKVTYLPSMMTMAMAPGNAEGDGESIFGLSPSHHINDQGEKDPLGKKTSSISFDKYRD